jgi:hypothetical protein
VVASEEASFAMNKQTWFRVVVDGNGKAVDCRSVGESGTAELGVYFVLADSAEQAKKQAGKSHAAKLLAARRARYHAEGLCKCGRKRDRPNPAGGLWQVCSGCVSRHAVHEERKRKRERGETVPPLDRRVVLQERKQSEAETIRLAVLEEARDAWRKHSTVGGYTRWLENEIAKIAGRKVA